MTVNAMWNKSKNKKKLLLIVIGVAVLIPLPITVSPEWKVVIKDSTNDPVKNLNVLNSWRHSTFQLDESMENLKSDNDGIVRIPERKAYIPIIGLIFNPILNTLSTGAHTSFGAHSIIYASTDNCETGYAYYSPDDASPKVLQLEKKTYCN